MKPTRLNKYIHEKPVLVEMSRNWMQFGHVWLRLSPHRPKWRLRAGVETTRTTVLARTRWQEDIAAGDRFRRGREILLIQEFIDPDGAGRWLDCTCLRESVYAAAQKQAQQDAQQVIKGDSNV